MYTLFNEVAKKTNGVTYDTRDEANAEAKRLGKPWVISTILRPGMTLELGPTLH